MKKLLTIIMLFLTTAFYAQQSYNDLWKIVEKNETEGLPMSALKQVSIIEKKAKAESNPAQFIKALLHKSKYALVLEEDAQIQIINNFKTEIKTAKAPTKNILENILAHLYWQYFLQNRYKFYNSTHTLEKVDANDFRTWDLQTLFNEVNLHFKNSLQNAATLQQEKLEQFDAILNTQKNSKLYRPTIYDFLSHQALEFYKSTENSITQPAYKFEIDQALYLSEANNFVNAQLHSNDSLALPLQALKIYQNLIQFHLKNKNLKALTSVNIERLQYVYKAAVLTNKDSIYEHTLLNEKQLISKNEASGLYAFELATLYQNQGSTYQPKINEKHRWKMQEALAICNTTIEQFPKSIASEKCETLKQYMLSAKLNLTLEKHIPIEKPSRILVQYKNIDTLYFQVYQLNENQYEAFQKIYKTDEKQQFLNKLQPIKQFQYTLINKQDFQTHSIEVGIPELKNGRYIISSNAKNNSIFAYSAIQVTNLALVEQQEENQQTYQVINRNNGSPIANAKITISYRENYNSNFKSITKSTNNAGIINIPKSDFNYRNVSIQVETLYDKAFFENYYINRAYKNNNPLNKTTYKGFIFTDRSIYRPGQTVYFKGIAMQTSNGKSQIIPHQLFYLDVDDVNGNEIITLKLQSNEFGSVSGEFILPTSSLNGQFSINFYGDKNNVDVWHPFSVEEYKRPKFEANFKPVTKTYKVNDSITALGKVVAFSGSNITNAKVTYRVKRTAIMPRWCYWYSPWISSEEQEITKGETVTNNKGEFTILFKALPDTSIDKKNLPIFNYEVTAAVTDINGETHTATSLIKVGYHTLTANITIAEKINKNNKNQALNIKTQNLNGEFVPAKGTVKMYKLQAPKTVMRKRPWQEPDYQNWTQANFKTIFPHDAFSKESDYKNWESADLVLSEKVNTEKIEEIPLKNIKNWESGWYKIVLEIKDKNNQLIKDIAYTNLYSNSDKTVSDNQLFQIYTNKDQYQVGEKVTVTFGSAAKNITVFVSLSKHNRTVYTKQFNLNNNKQSVTIPIEKTDVGGFSIHYYFAVYNSFENGTLNIPVPYPNSDLEIETLTFRDKLDPGKKETWSFKIIEPKGEKVATEILASMYDASLDQFKQHSWTFNPLYKPTKYSRSNTRAYPSFGTKSFRVYNNHHTYYNPTQNQYDTFNWFGFYFGNKHYLMRSLAGKVAGISAENAMELEVGEDMAEEFDGNNLDEVVVTAMGVKKEKELPENKETINNITIRKNLQETAFFYPKLQTNNKGEVSFSFTTPEALTKWKLQLLAHTKNLNSAVKQLETVTQKKLMVVPNTPRFLREGDTINISSKISNLTNKNLTGQANLQLFNALTGAEITSAILQSVEAQNFSVHQKNNTQVTWQLAIPKSIQAIQYKVIAKAGNFSNGEQNTLPVLSNRMLVTETLPMWVNSNQTKTFTLEKLKNNQSKTLSHHKLTLEVTSNPAWYAVQALPYLMEYPYQCNEQTFSRYYANALASHIANSNPKIQEVFKLWKNKEALISNLEKNADLKSIIIQETPWVREAQSETEQKKRIALLFDINKMKNELQNSLQKLQQNQMANGAWSWFQGGYANRFITQHIVTGFGHLKHLQVKQNDGEKAMIKKAINYLDNEFVNEYNNLKKYNKNTDLNKDHLSYSQLQYLYMRSFYSNIKMPLDATQIKNYYLTQIKKYWLSRSLYAKGLMALIIHREENTVTANKILNSLKENSITSEELGMYWKANTNSWFWYQAPIETQALLIEAFTEIENNTETIDKLKIWLLKNKQTNRWKTTKATTEAVYALLLQGSDWLNDNNMVQVNIGGKPLQPATLENVKTEAGTGYFKTSWNAPKIQPQMANVTLHKKGKGIAWASLYWQYFEDLDKISTAKTPLKLRKELFKRTFNDTGEVLSKISDDTMLQVGDLVRVRIELQSDRDMEFVHLKDMRAAGLEPVNVLSQYKWQDGLGYYETTKDASTNFFFDYLQKGIYVFEYDLRVNNSGKMNNGITTIQSMYAPEFSSHSKGMKINVD